MKSCAEPSLGQGPWVWPAHEGTYLAVELVPGAERSEVAGLPGGALKAGLAAPSFEGKANQPLVEFLADPLGVPKRCVEIRKGERGRAKLLFIRGVTALEVAKTLSPKGAIRAHGA